LIKIGGKTPVFTEDAPGGSGRLAIQVQYLIHIFFQVYLSVFHFEYSALLFPEIVAFDGDGMTEVPEAAEKRLDHLRVAEKVGPFVVA
jgi:hypothetical protein